MFTEIGPVEVQEAADEVEVDSTIHDAEMAGFEADVLDGELPHDAFDPRLLLGATQTEESSSEPSGVRVEVVDSGTEEGGQLHGHLNEIRISSKGGQESPEVEVGADGGGNDGNDDKPPTGGNEGDGDGHEDDGEEYTLKDAERDRWRVTRQGADGEIDDRTARQRFDEINQRLGESIMTASGLEPRPAESGYEHEEARPTRPDTPVAAAETQETQRRLFRPDEATSTIEEVLDRVATGNLRPGDALDVVREVVEMTEGLPKGPIEPSTADVLAMVKRITEGGSRGRLKPGEVLDAMRALTNQYLDASPTTDEKSN